MTKLMIHQPPLSSIIDPTWILIIRPSGRAPPSWTSAPTATSPRCARPTLTPTGLNGPTSAISGFLATHSTQYSSPRLRTFRSPTPTGFLLRTSFRHNNNSNHSEPPSPVPTLVLTHRASLRIHSLSPTRDIAGTAAPHPDARHSVTRLLPRYNLRLRCITPTSRWTILGANHTATKFFRYLTPAQRVVARSTCFVALYSQGSLLKMGTSVDLLFAVSKCSRSSTYFRVQILPLS